jgi:hypothetical protein
VYFGLAVPYEHVAVARRLTSRQARVFSGGSVALRADSPPAPFNYFAVRDPSSVKVMPVKLPPLGNGFRHVKLAFNFERYYQPSTDPDSQSAVDALETSMHSFSEGKDRPATAAFLITIGLPTHREERFFHDAIASNPGQAWADFYNLITEFCKHPS